MRTFTAVVERCPDTDFHIGYVPGLAGAHTQGETLDELSANLVEVLALILEDGDPAFETEFAGTPIVRVRSAGRPRSRSASPGIPAVGPRPPP